MPEYVGSGRTSLSNRKQAKDSARPLSDIFCDTSPATFKGWQGESMIISLYRRAKVIARLTNSSWAPQLDAMVLSLQKQGYAPSTIQNCVLSADKFCKWLAEQCIALADVNEALLDRYTKSLPRRIRPAHPRGTPHNNTGGLLHLLSVLRDAHLISPRPSPPPTNEAERWLAHYAKHLQERVGAAWSTRRKCLLYVRRLIEFRFPDSDPDWSMLNASDIVSFLSGQARHGESAVKTGASAVRSLLRFLVLEGILRPGLEAAVPPQPRWRLSGLPRFLTVEQVERVLTVCRESPSNSVRNIAVLLLLARLGLRGDEVAHLQFEDVNWRDGLIRIRSRKSLRERQLPLPAEVGTAVAKYLRESRPSSTSRSIFLHCHAPFSQLRNTGVGCIARRLLNAAGISITRPGAHVFRHSAATHMIRRGATLPEVAEVLGHLDLETTALYAKLDLDTLAAVALPWPGGGQ
jgi:integrase/recombinase XerD